MNKEYRKYSDIQLFEKMNGTQAERQLAFAEIYSRYSHRVYSYCLRLRGNVDDANDIFQETFLKLFYSIDHLDHIDNFLKYLIKITRNLHLNYNRTQVDDVNFDELVLISNDRSYEQKELLNLIANALECLEFDYREAFILRLYQGLSYKEISDITGVSVATLKNRVWRAKEKIKEILEPILDELSK